MVNIYLVHMSGLSNLYSRLRSEYTCTVCTIVLALHSKTSSDLKRLLAYLVHVVTGLSIMYTLRIHVLFARLYLDISLTL